MTSHFAVSPAHLFTGLEIDWFDLMTIVSSSKIAD